MGKSRGLYQAEFPQGSKVQIANRAHLERFLGNWEFHHSLPPDQLEFADKIATVKSVGFYHGGDELYALEDVPGLWHEQCLRLLHDQDRE